MKILAATVLAVLALGVAPAEARRSSSIRSSDYCTSGGCFSHDRSSGFYRRSLNSDGGIARRSDRSSSGRRSRY